MKVVELGKVIYEPSGILWALELQRFIEQQKALEAQWQSFFRTQDFLRFIKVKGKDE